ncbi:uncharacterized protein LOC120680640 isoform X2 [Panicum virgatum]|uniref:uncharacterized protein LOC120680640 isoform X2 n=1 Tax=Panicum virgatum TaxID=38727 RepID=UPI0019D681E4|nr:uncharacterized protein LOC120680640 isoform X2 [Panicum virgatum]
MAIDLNLLPEGDREAIPDLNEVVGGEESAASGEQDAINHGGNNEIVGEEEDPSIVVQEADAHGSGGQCLQHFDLNVEPDMFEEFNQEDQGINTFTAHPMDMSDAPVDFEEFDEDELQGIESVMADYGVYADEVDIVFDQQAHRSKNLNEMQRQAIYAALLERSSNGEKKRYYQNCC